jgi:uncharacterized protein YecE (DUF72 family)
VKPVRIGCSGWNYQHWRNGVFYPPRLPPRRWLEFYARHFDTVEVNATFYRLPRETAVANWVQETPPGFLFAVKMSRYATHIKRLRDLSPSIELFAETLGQLPPGRHCFEFRDESWFVDEVYELLRAHGVALVIGDTPRRAYPHVLTADWAFVRFHHGKRGRNGNYSERELEEWAARIGGWAEKHEVFAYFNNDWSGYAVRNGLWLRRRLGV